MNIRYPIYEGVYRILTFQPFRICCFHPIHAPDHPTTAVPINPEMPEGHG